MTTNKTEIDRAIAHALRELRDHGGNQKDVNHIIGEFKKLAEEETHHGEAMVIPD